MKKRRVVSGALACLMGFATVGSLAACGKSGGGNVIHVAYAQAGYGGGMMLAYKEEFEELHTDAYGNKRYTVYLEGSEGMTAEFSTRLDTGSNLPDVFMVLDTGWQKQAAMGKLLNLDDVYSAAWEYDPDGGRVVGDTIAEKIQPGILDYGKVNSAMSGGEHYFSVPWSDGATGIVYNKTKFDEYGWEIPTTVDELVELCNKINAARIPTGNSQQPYVKPFAIFGSYGGYVGDTWWAQYEGAENYRKFFNYETAKIQGVDVPVGYLQQGRVEALKAFEKLFYDQELGDKINTAYGINAHTSAQMAFGNQYALMIMEGAWVEMEGGTYLKGDFEYAMMPTPWVTEEVKNAYAASGKQQILASQAGDFMCIPSEAKNTEGAVEFLKYVNSRQGCETYTKATRGALRPFDYKASEIAGFSVSSFMRSCWEYYENSQVVYSYSTSPLQWTNKLGKWPGEGGVYDGILIGKYATVDPDTEEPIRDANGNIIPQAIKICSLCRDYAFSKYDEIYKEIS